MLCVWASCARFHFTVCSSSSCTRREGEEVHRGEGSVPLAFRGRWLAQGTTLYSLGWLIAFWCFGCWRCFACCALWVFSRISAENGRHRGEKGRRWVLPKLSASILGLGGWRRLCFGEQSELFGCAATATPALYCVSCLVLLRASSFVYFVAHSSLFCSPLLQVLATSQADCEIELLCSNDFALSKLA